eukprot:TRINITY_DN52541_c0_g1_i1.p1 TRINITY_DN52541_c0_g1~~TRINITY_DN52541_c0_g1_i1.p1  ORF type:complete len:140 (+),score=31.54 TRINITY_DN52541_c0_g1_i1:44-463(+)
MAKPVADRLVDVVADVRDGQKEMLFLLERLKTLRTVSSQRQQQCQKRWFDALGRADRSLGLMRDTVIEMQHHIESLAVVPGLVPAAITAPATAATRPSSPCEVADSNAGLPGGLAKLVEIAELETMSEMMLHPTSTLEP